MCNTNSLEPRATSYAVDDMSSLRWQHILDKTASEKMTVKGERGDSGTGRRDAAGRSFLLRRFVWEHESSDSDEET